MNVIETRGLTKDYGRGRGVFALDLAVKQGQVLGFLALPARARRRRPAC